MLRMYAYRYCPVETVNMVRCDASEYVRVVEVWLARKDEYFDGAGT